ncbi:putative leucine-rich repeat-containing protein DDB_G0290503 isoform X1 [Chironomus tepperi]|uniref:putative leucine-rich repeat-containing protein DDB_G0290503 isoform X1 n=1 Tax=Chironomus tepperi TaxID=113505 RepID=UPI00391F9874
MKPFYWISKMMYLFILILNIKDGVADNISSLRLRKARNPQQTKATSDCEIISEAIQSLGLKLDQSFKMLENNMMERMSKLDDKVNLLHDKMFKENILTSSNRTPRPETESIESKIELIEQQMNNIKLKMNDFVDMIGDKLLNNNHKTSEDDTKSRNVNSIVEAASEEMITRFNGFSTAIEEMNRKIQQNKNLLMQNYGELMTIAEHLNNKKNDNSSVLTQQNEHRIQQQQQQQQQKKERVFDHSLLINEILRMVRNRLSGDNNENENLPIIKLPVFPADSPTRRTNIDDSNYSSSTFQT